LRAPCGPRGRRGQEAPGRSVGWRYGPSPANGLQQRVATARAVYGRAGDAPGRELGGAKGNTAFAIPSAATSILYTALQCFSPLLTHRVQAEGSPTARRL